MREKISVLIDTVFKPKGVLLKEGGALVFRKLLSEETKQELRKHFSIHLNEAGTYQYVVDRNLESILLRLIAKDCKSLLDIIKDYVGNSTCDIAYYFESWTDADAHRNSQLAHHDSVGHRLKLFVPMEIGWTTYFLKNSHTIHHLSDSSQDKALRMRLTEDLGKNMDKIKLEFGDLLLFDTNGLHKGHVENGYRGSVLVFEFSHYLKRSWQGKVGKRSIL